MNDDQLLAWIQALVRAGRFAFTDHALTKHPVAEHFAAQDAIVAVLSGSMIQHRQPESRCVICGEAPTVVADVRFHGGWIHCVVQYDRETEVVIITMYRPTRKFWITPFTRR